MLRAVAQFEYQVTLGAEAQRLSVFQTNTYRSLDAS